MAMFEKKTKVAIPKRATWARDGRKKGPNIISFSVKSPADSILGVDNMFGAYLMDDGSIGVMMDYDECDEDYGDEYVGEALINCWYRDGTYEEGGCYAFKWNQSVRDWCEWNEYPTPVREISFSFSDALERGASAEDVFAILDEYLAGNLDNPDDALATLY